MGAFVRGEVVIIPFPFSDLSTSKRRPAVVIAQLEGDDVILCQITSQARTDSYGTPITGSDFVSGNLLTNSVVRPNRLFTADERIVVRRVGLLTKNKIEEIKEKLIEIIS